MKIFNLFLAILLSSLTLSSTWTDHYQRGNLILNISNIKNDSGIIWIGIYDSAENFLVKEKALIERFDISSFNYRQKITIESLKYGEYAIALFHDINGNGELDQNFIGIPSEPYAFSKKPKSKWRMPKFDEIKFEFINDQQILSTRLEKW